MQEAVCLEPFDQLPQLLPIQHLALPDRVRCTSHKQPALAVSSSSAPGERAFCSPASLLFAHCATHTNITHTRTHTNSQQCSKLATRTLCNTHKQPHMHTHKQPAVQQACHLHFVQEPSSNLGSRRSCQVSFSIA